MKKEPWKPQRPKLAHKCPQCKGTGKVYFQAPHYSFSTNNYTDARDCHRCGGKGYL